MFHLFIIIPILTFGITCSASVEILMGTQNQQELEKYIYKNNHDLLIKTSCLLQLRIQKTPFFCYEWFSKSLKLLSQQEFLSFLDEKCLEFASSLKHLNEITHITGNPYISPVCLRKLQEIKNVLIYQLRDKSPKKFLQWHLKPEFSKKKF